jgi:hypothetical protein
MAKFRKRLLTEIIPSIKNPSARTLLTKWYEYLPAYIKMGLIPEFIEDSITTYSNRQEKPFSIIYCRCTIWRMLEDGENSLRCLSIQIRKLLKPDIGRLIIVEPSNNGDIDYRYDKVFQSEGIILKRMEEDKRNLGWMEPFGDESERKDITGYIFYIKA